ncbi:MAG: SPOR domain-containing protein [Legionella sp.]|nr:SPOR domain-containing protein [Legionella sp.]
MQYYQYQQNYQRRSSYNIGTDYGYDGGSRGQVTVPDSYHVGAYHSPTAAKDRDRRWVSSQNPQGYTIEIADDEKASQVAKKLYQIPKKEPMAEIKYQRDGKAYYKGLYGTYVNPEEAQKALNSLPDDVKQGAGIRNWGNLQNNISE